MNRTYAACATLALTGTLPLLTGCSRDEPVSHARQTASRTTSLASTMPVAANNATSVPASAGAAVEKGAGAAEGENKPALAGETAGTALHGEIEGRSDANAAKSLPSSLTPAPSAFGKRITTDAMKNMEGYAANKGSLLGRFAGRMPGAAPAFPIAAGAAMPREQSRAVYNPNMYVADTYIGGNGEKDRLEKLIQAGVVVDGQRVKLEAFTHDYAQAFPIPQNSALSVAAEGVQSKIIQSGAHTYLQIGLQATKGELPRRPPLNVALVIDRSGSMSDEHKLDYAKSAAAQLVNSLTSADTFSLVAFDDTAKLLVPAQHVVNKARIRSLISELTPGGGTNIYEGLQKAYAQVHKNASGEAINRVILLSDGQVTAGIQDAGQFHHLAAMEADRDVQTSAVGVGVEFNEDLMLSLARDGKGNYHFLKDGADTQQVFARELNELTHVVARNVKLRIQLAPGVGLIRVLGAQTLDAQQTAQVKQEEKKIDRKVAEELGIAPDRQNAPEEPGIKMLIPALYRGDSHIVMLEIKVPPQQPAFGFARNVTKSPGNSTSQGMCRLADVFVKYKDLVHPANREARATAAVTYTPSKDEMIYSVNRSVKKNLLGFQTGEALMQAAQSIAQGRIGDAIAQVEERRNIVGIAAQQWQDRDLERDGKLLERYKTVLAQLNTHQQLAQGDFGQYLRRSLAYNGYQMTR